MIISTTIAFVLSNLPAFLLVLALAIAALGLGRGGLAHRFLNWILLLPIGGMALWAALGHLAFPVQVASYIGWQPSPFQFEVGMADLAIGVVACIAFRSSLSFKGATIWVVSIFLLGDAIGHLRNMLMAANFAPGNAGVVFYMDIILPLTAIGLWLAARREEAAYDVSPTRFA
jgi:hypothetical protein